MLTIVPDIAETVWPEARLVLHRVVRRRLVPQRQLLARREDQLHRPADGGGRRGPLHYRGSPMES